MKYINAFILFTKRLDKDFSLQTKFLFMFGEDDKISPQVLTHGITKSLILKCKTPSNCEIMSLPGTGHMIELPNAAVSSIGRHAFFPRHQMTFGGSNIYLHSIGGIKVWQNMLEFFKVLK